MIVEMRKPFFELLGFKIIFNCGLTFLKKRIDEGGDDTDEGSCEEVTRFVSPFFN